MSTNHSAKFCGLHAGPGARRAGRDSTWIPILVVLALVSGALRASSTPLRLWEEAHYSGELSEGDNILLLLNQEGLFTGAMMGQIFGDLVFEKKDLLAHPAVPDSAVRIKGGRESATGPLIATLESGLTVLGNAGVDRKANLSASARPRFIPTNPVNPGGDIDVVVTVDLHGALTPPPGEGNVQIFLSGGIIPATDPEELRPTLALVSISGGPTPLVFKLGDMLEQDPDAVRYDSTAGHYLVDSSGYQIPLTLTEGMPYDMVSTLSVSVRNASGEQTAGQVDAFDTSRFTLSWSDPNVQLVAVPPTNLLNISTRLRVGSGENALIGGFIITGSEAKRVIIRAIGPSLAQQGVAGALENPTLQLFDGAGDPITSNDNWKDDQQAEIEATTIPPGNDLESAIVRTLQPGNYTAVVRGKDDTNGIGLVEVYDVSSGANARLANISSRGVVETGENVLIGGFITGGGDDGARVVVRAIGPSLGAAGVQGALQDPTLQLVDANGTDIRANDNWKESQQAELEALQIAPTNELEAALLATIPGGNYTAIVRGKNGATGVGLVEVYHVR